MNKNTIDNELMTASVKETLKAYKTMNKKELEVNFDIKVTELEIYKDDDKYSELLCLAIDAIAHELYTRINNKLH
jgi:translation elongation factor EF-1beta